MSWWGDVWGAVMRDKYVYETHQFGLLWTSVFFINYVNVCVFSFSFGVGSWVPRFLNEQTNQPTNQPTNDG